jgi:hypothetical protein
MKTVAMIVSEPHTKYQTEPWYSNSVAYFNSEILRIDDEKIVVKQNSLKIQIPLTNEKRTKISSLRGKMGKVKDELIDKKLFKLRNEWNRDF